jgi:hypothetical protein
VGGHVVEEGPQHPLPRLAHGAGERPQDLDVLRGELCGEGLELSLVSGQLPMQPLLSVAYMDELMDQARVLHEQGILTADEDPDRGPFSRGDTGLAGRESSDEVHPESVEGREVDEVLEAQGLTWPVTRHAGPQEGPGGLAPEAQEDSRVSGRAQPPL